MRSKSIDNIINVCVCVTIVVERMRKEMKSVNKKLESDFSRVVDSREKTR